MNGLLCRLGIHQPTFQPVTDPRGWLHLRVCTRCSQPVERRPR